MPLLFVPPHFSRCYYYFFKSTLVCTLLSHRLPNLNFALQDLEDLLMHRLVCDSSLCQVYLKRIGDVSIGARLYLRVIIATHSFAFRLLIELLSTDLMSPKYTLLR